MFLINLKKVIGFWARLYLVCYCICMFYAAVRNSLKFKLTTCYVKTRGVQVIDSVKNKNQACMNLLFFICATLSFLINYSDSPREVIYLIVILYWFTHVLCTQKMIYPACSNYSYKMSWINRVLQFSLFYFLGQLFFFFV